MGDTVQSALAKRKAQQQTEQQSRIDTYKKEQDSVTAALNAREKRIASSIDSVVSDLNSRMESVIKSYNDSVSVKPSFGANVYDVYKNQRHARMDVSNLLLDVEAYRKHFGDETTDSAVAALKEIQMGYDSILDQAQLMSQWNTEDEYNEWRNKEDFISEYLSDPEKATATMTYKQDWLKEAESRAESSAILNADDFNQHSRYTSTEIGRAHV